jgi:RimJ/RimL family protein N-acetyltransferase
MFMNENPSSPRLSFRCLQHEDAALLFPAIDAKLTEHWIDWEPPLDFAELQQKIHRSIEQTKIGRAVEFLVFSVESKTFVGCGSFSPNAYCELEIGYWVKSEQQRQGYGYEMLQALLFWLQNELFAVRDEQVGQRSSEQRFPYDVNKVIYSVTTGNQASEAVAQKLLGAPYMAAFQRRFSARKRGIEREVTDYVISLQKSVLLPGWML